MVLLDRETISQRETVGLNLWTKLLREIDVLDADIRPATISDRSTTVVSDDSHGHFRLHRRLGHHFLPAPMVSRNQRQCKTVSNVSG